MIIAIDFDGTIVKHRFPNVGEAVPLALETMRDLQNEGHRIMLWTVRHDKYLIDAINFLQDNGFKNIWINNNPGQSRWSGSNKQHADLYIDDLGWGVDLVEDTPFKPYVNWQPIRDVFQLDGKICDQTRLINRLKKGNKR